MRDLHFDGGFMRDFNAASNQWPWATWHEVRAAQEATARRLLDQVFGVSDESDSSVERGETEE